LLRRSSPSICKKRATSADFLDRLSRRRSRGVEKELKLEVVRIQASARQTVDVSEFEMPRSRIIRTVLGGLLDVRRTQKLEHEAVVLLARAATAGLGREVAHAVSNAACAIAIRDGDSLVVLQSLTKGKVAEYGVEIEIAIGRQSAERPDLEVIRNERSLKIARCAR
jgi:hypothetical protein